MITIEGLTPRQIQLMDLIWNCEDQDEVEALILALPSIKDQWDGLCLMKIAIVEVMEDQGYLNEYTDQARDAINRARINSLR